MYSGHKTEVWDDSLCATQSRSTRDSSEDSRFFVPLVPRSPWDLSLSTSLTVVGTPHLYGPTLLPLPLHRDGPRPGSLEVGEISVSEGTGGPSRDRGSREPPEGRSWGPPTDKGVTRMVCRHRPRNLYRHLTNFFRLLFSLQTTIEVPLNLPETLS